MVMFRTIRISDDSYQWLQKEKKRTKLSIKTLVDAALVHLVSLSRAGEVRKRK